MESNTEMDPKMPEAYLTISRDEPDEVINPDNIAQEVAPVEARLAAAEDPYPPESITATEAWLPNSPSPSLETNLNEMVTMNKLTMAKFFLQTVIRLSSRINDMHNSMHYNKNSVHDFLNPFSVQNISLSTLRYSQRT